MRACAPRGQALHHPRRPDRQNCPCAATARRSGPPGFTRELPTPRKEWPLAWSGTGLSAKYTADLVRPELAGRRGRTFDGGVEAEGHCIAHGRRRRPCPGSASPTRSGTTRHPEYTADSPSCMAWTNARRKIRDAARHGDDEAPIAAVPDERSTICVSRAPRTGPPSGVVKHPQGYKLPNIAVPPWVLTPTKSRTPPSGSPPGCSRPCSWRWLLRLKCRLRPKSFRAVDERHGISFGPLMLGRAAGSRRPRRDLAGQIESAPIAPHSRWWRLFMSRSGG